MSLSLLALAVGFLVFRRPVVPPRRPNISAEKAARYLRHAGVSLDGPVRVVVLFVRGYYLDSYGAHGINDRNTYDGAAVVCLVGRGQVHDVTTFNANTDPSGQGMNRSVGKPYPSICPGVWRYRFGLHRGRYLALKPSSYVEVVRDGRTSRERNASINIHAGGFDWTWSWGCLTVVKTQYGARSKSTDRGGSGFIDVVWRLAERCGQGGSTAEGRAVWRAHPGRTNEPAIEVAVVDERAFRGAGA